MTYFFARISGQKFEVLGIFWTWCYGLSHDISKCPVMILRSEEFLLHKFSKFQQRNKPIMVHLIRGMLIEL